MNKMEVLSGCAVRAEIQKEADALVAALVQLANARDFLKRCKDDGERAIDTGALRDAREWCEETADAVIATARELGVVPRAGEHARAAS